MKMKNKRKTMLIAALAVAVIALAGVGYAATAWTGTTINSDNTAEGVYIKVTQLNDDYDGAFTTATPIGINTYTDARFTSPIYSLMNSTQIVTGWYGVEIGSGATLEIEPTGATYNTYQIDFKASSLPAGWSYLMVFGTGNNAKSDVITSADLSGQVTGVTLTDDKVVAHLYIVSDTLFQNIKNGQLGPLDTTVYEDEAASTNAPTNNGTIFTEVNVTFTVAGEVAQQQNP